MKRISISLFASLLLAVPAFAQSEAEDTDNTEVSEEVDNDEGEGRKTSISHYHIGDGVRLVSSDGYHMTLSGLVQTTASTRHYGDIDQQYNRLRVRRARLRFDGDALNARVRYRVGLDFIKGSETDAEGAGSMLQDAWIGYRPWGDNRLQVTFGQRATPTDNIELSMSSHTLSFVERSKVTSVFSTIREVGLFVESSHRLGHTRGVLRPSLAITDGDGPISGGKRYGGLKYGARLNYLPLGTFRNYGQSRESDMAYEFTPKLCLGVAYSYTDGTSDRRGGRSSGDILYMNDKNRYELPDMGKLVADVNFKYAGFSTIVEFARSWGYVSDKITQRVRTAGTVSSDFAVDGLSGNHPVEYIKNRMLLGYGLNVQAGYMFRSRWSIDARYTHIGSDTYSYLNNDLYYNRPDYFDVAVAKYLTRSYASKVQMTVGYARPNGECRTPDSQYYSGGEWNVDLMIQFKF